MKTLAGATFALLLTGVAAPALAQSGPDWSGPYIGISGGVAEGDEQDSESIVFDRNFDGSFNDTVATTGGANAFSPGFCPGEAVASSAAGGCDGDETGLTASLRTGWDFQFGSFVVGGVAEITGADIDDTVTEFSSTPASYVFRRELDRLAALRLRVGFAAGDALFYATGGYAAGEITNSFFTSNGANRFDARVDEDRAEGSQFGGGIEYRLTGNLTITGEYLMTDLDAPDYVIRVGQGAAPATNPFILPPNAAGTDIRRSSDQFKFGEFRIGMNLRY